MEPRSESYVVSYYQSKLRLCYSPMHFVSGRDQCEKLEAIKHQSISRNHVNAMGAPGASEAAVTLWFRDNAHRQVIQVGM